MSPRKKHKARSDETAPPPAEPTPGPAEPPSTASTPPPPSFTRRHAIGLALIACAVALIESALGLYQPRHIASDADWQAATRYVRQQLRPEDLVLAAPPWADPTLRQHLGDRMPIEMVARPDEDLYPRIYELSVHDARAAETANLVVAEERRFGGVTVRRFDKAASRRLYDFTSELAHAKISTRGNGANATDEPCRFAGPAALCLGARIERRVLEIDYRPRLGVLAPMIAGRTTRIEYDDVPGGGTLVGYVGLHDYYARKNGDAVVMFHVRVDDTKSVTIPVRNPRKDGEGWQRFELPLDPGLHRVRFELDAADAHFRLPGFHAEVRQP